MDNKELEMEIMNNAIMYSNNIKAYDEYLNFVAYLVRALALPENTLSIVMITNLLMKSGIFSKNAEFKYAANMNNNIEGFLGLNVINGHGNSRNMSAFISDVLTKLGYKATTLPVRISDDVKCEDNDKSANQTLTIVEYNGVLYGYDVINNTFYSFVSDNIMKEIHSNNPLYAFCMSKQDVKISDIISEAEFNYIAGYSNKQIKKDNKLLFSETVRFSKQYIDVITNGVSLDKTKTKK